jgi:cytochrome c
VPPTDHVRTLRDYAKRSISYGFEEHFDPDDADDIADYIEKLEAENAELQSKINTVKLAAKYAAKIRDARIEKLEAVLRFYACDCKPDDGCGIEYYDGGAYCGYTAREALEGKDDAD